MADFAPNFTARYRLHYTVLGRQHAMLWRIQRGTGSTGLALMTAKVKSFLDGLALARFIGWTETSAEYAPEDVDIFAPAALPGSIPGVVVVPANALSQSTLAISYVGRSSIGQKARLFVYGVEAGLEGPNAAIADNFRIAASENGTVAGSINTLNSGSPQIFASDNFAVTFYQYVNVKYNDHWVKRVRG